MEARSGATTEDIPSGKRVALEWYMRGMVDAESPSRDHFLPEAAEGS